MKGLLITLLLTAAFAQWSVFGQSKKDSTNLHADATVHLKGLTIHQEVDSRQAPEVYEPCSTQNNLVSFPGFSPD